jgi:DNA-binding transcriptional regulator YiaG
VAYSHTTKVGRFTVTDRRLSSRLRRMKDGTPILSAKQLGELERRAAITVLRDIDLVTGDELKFARKVLGLRQAELAQYLGVLPETVCRWENGQENFKRRDQLAVLALLEEVHRGGSLPQPKAAREAGDFELIAGWG